MKTCERCGLFITGTSVVQSFGGDGQRTYCMDCNNEVVAEFLDTGYQREEFEPYRIRDAYGNEHIFIFEVHVFPAGIEIRAREFGLEREDEGYMFEILGGFDRSPREIHAQLLQKIDRALRRRHFETGTRDVSLKDVVRGRIGYDYDSGDTLLVIDGKNVSLDDFGRMLDTYGGFQFRLEFIDPSDEVK